MNLLQDCTQHALSDVVDVIRSAVAEKMRRNITARTLTQARKQVLRRREFMLNVQVFNEAPKFTICGLDENIMGNIADHLEKMFVSPSINL